MLPRISWIALTLAALFSLTTYAQPADELIANNIKARGGMEKIKSVKALKLTGKMVAQGMEAPLLIQSKRPNLTRMDVTIQGQPMTRPLTA